ncbi:hypothetical protein ES689_08125 [Frigoribacterium sp. ACAM 257]|uniref:hypothetical protein n=1 Tax=Frigoribacterium sp. ACAM 257 TaxID=2508998 RepID=UPI0011B94E7A|nr:hypothetical protein [Frigoribacterium sp. ACAM 257]TWX38582.1 hypothetical protein ES689_08125 [Frigoribacterium sp. ACAM 257]
MNTPVPDTHSPSVVHRPSSRQLVSVAKTRFVLVAVVIAWAVLRGNWAGLVVLAVLAPILAVGLASYLRGTTVTASPTQLTYRRPWSTKVVLLDGQQRGLLCLVDQRIQRLGVLAVRGADGTRIVLTEGYFDFAVLADIAERCGVPIASPDQPLTGKQIRGHAPGLIPRWMA